MGETQQVPCPGCGKEISTALPTCPFCGRNAERPQEQPHVQPPEKDPVPPPEGVSPPGKPLVPRAPYSRLRLQPSGRLIGRPGGVRGAVFCYAITIAIGVLSQVLRFAISDEMIIDLVKQGAYAERVSQIARGFPESVLASKEEISRRIDLKRFEIIDKARGELDSKRTLASIILAAMTLLALGLWYRVRFAWILAVLGSIILSVGGWVNLPNALEIYEKFNHVILIFEPVAFGALGLLHALAFFMLLSRASRAYFRGGTANAVPPQALKPGA